MKTHAELTRTQRIEKILSQRRLDLCLVLENLTEDANISAILRTAEGFGVGKIYIIHPIGKKPKVSRGAASGAAKWLETAYFTDTKKCLEEVKKMGFRVFGTHVNPDSRSIFETKFTGQVALVMGNEAQGISEEVTREADQLIYLPMQGLTESFNVSVATALFLYEVIRQKVKDLKY